MFANQGCQKSDKVDFVNPLCKTPEKPEHKPIDTKKELASIAGVSHDTIAKVQKIEEKGYLRGQRVEEWERSGNDGKNNETG